MGWINKLNPLSIGSMYGIVSYIWLISMIYVGKYTIHMDPMGYTTSVIIIHGKSLLTPNRNPTMKPKFKL